jgi:glucokinase
MGDLVAVTAVSRAALYLGLGLGGLINALGPEIVIIGGGVAEALGDKWVAQVREVARRQSLVDPDDKIRIEPAALGDDAGILGAALIARERFVLRSNQYDAAPPLDAGAARVYT